MIERAMRHNNWFPCSDTLVRWAVGSAWKAAHLVLVGGSCVGTCKFLFVLGVCLSRVRACVRASCTESRILSFADRDVKMRTFS